MGSLNRWTRLAGCLLALGASAAPGAARADYSVSNNLSGASGGVESATGTTYLTAGFGSGTAGGTLASVTLLLGNSVAGAAEVDIYADSGLQPGTEVGILSHAGGYSASPSGTTFLASGITLAANTNYWVVLRALAGQFDWSWTAANAGTGAGYQNTWGESDDAGTTWFTYDSYPTQMNVVLTGAAAVPEPSTLVLWGLGFAAVAACRGRRRRPDAPPALALAR